MLVDNQVLIGFSWTKGHSVMRKPATSTELGGKIEPRSDGWSARSAGPVTSIDERWTSSGSHLPGKA